MGSLKEILNTVKFENQGQWQQLSKQLSLFAVEVVWVLLILLILRLYY